MNKAMLHESLRIPLASHRNPRGPPFAAGAASPPGPPEPQPATASPCMESRAMAADFGHFDYVDPQPLRAAFRNAVTGLSTR